MSLLVYKSRISREGGLQRHAMVKFRFVPHCPDFCDLITRLEIILLVATWQQDSHRAITMRQLLPQCFDYTGTWTYKGAALESVAVKNVATYYFPNVRDIVIFGSLRTIVKGLASHEHRDEVTECKIRYSEYIAAVLEILVHGRWQVRMPPHDTLEEFWLYNVCH